MTNANENDAPTPDAPQGDTVPDHGEDATSTDNDKALLERDENVASNLDEDALQRVGEIFARLGIGTVNIRSLAMYGGDHHGDNRHGGRQAAARRTDDVAECWPDDVLERATDTPGDIALMTAITFLNGAPSSDIRSAADRLAKRLPEGHREEGEAAPRQRSVRALRDALRCESTTETASGDEDGFGTKRLKFSALEDWETCLDYLWEDLQSLPGWRTELANWLRGLALSPSNEVRQRLGWSLAVMGRGAARGIDQEFISPWLHHSRLAPLTSVDAYYAGLMELGNVESDYVKAKLARWARGEVGSDGRIAAGVLAGGVVGAQAPEAACEIGVQLFNSGTWSGLRQAIIVFSGRVIGAFQREDWNEMTHEIGLILTCLDGLNTDLRNPKSIARRSRLIGSVWLNTGLNPDSVLPPVCRLESFDRGLYERVVAMLADEFYADRTRAVIHPHFDFLARRAVCAPARWRAYFCMLADMAAALGRERGVVVSTCAGRWIFEARTRDNADLPAAKQELANALAGSTGAAKANLSHSTP